MNTQRSIVSLLIKRQGTTMSNLGYSKNFLGLGDLFFRDPERYLSIVKLLEVVMSGESELTHVQREAIALYTSRLNGCHYCISSHRAVLDALDVDLAFIDSIATGSIDSLDDKYEQMLVFAKKLTLDPGGLTQEEIEVVRTAGWSDQAIEDAIGVVSIFCMINRIVDAIGLPGSDEHFQQFGGMVSQGGYAPMVQMIEQKIK